MAKRPAPDQFSSRESDSEGTGEEPTSPPRKRAKVAVRATSIVSSIRSKTIDLSSITDESEDDDASLDNKEIGE
jgi:hypothetical protein